MATDQWEPVGVFTESEPVVLDGVNIWDAQWVPVGTSFVKVMHPAYPHQVHSVQRYEVSGTAGVVTFAAGELSANVWGVFVPRGSARAPVR